LGGERSPFILGEVTQGTVKLLVSGADLYLVGVELTGSATSKGCKLSTFGI
jgi:hypothetical protein